MPPPFGPNEKESIPSVLKRKHDDLLASDESELEDEGNEFSKETKLQERRVKQARLERITAEKQKLATASTVATSNPIPTATTNNTKSASATSKIKINIGKLAEPQHTSDSANVTDTSKTTTLTEEQQKIRDNCITVAERASFPIFKNYERGKPSNKLYLKNLGKHVTQKDLKELYANFSDDVQIDIMKKGRLRGHAFVTFPEEDIAAVALDSTNGYMLHDRPIAVLFGKSGVVTE